MASHPNPLITAVLRLHCLQICGYTVPAGCIVAFPPLAIDSARWSYGEDAEEFKPDRWVMVKRKREYPSRWTDLMQGPDNQA